METKELDAVMMDYWSGPAFEKWRASIFGENPVLLYFQRLLAEKKSAFYSLDFKGF